MAKPLLVVIGSACGVIFSLTGCQTSASEVTSVTTPSSNVTAATPTADSDTYPSPVKPKVMTHGPRDRSEVAFTFDADMTDVARQQLKQGKIPRQVNDELLAYLRETKTPVTVFITGLWAREYPAEVKQLGEDPLVSIGNHTWNHLAWTDNCYGLPHVNGVDEKKAEVRRTSQLLHRLTGKYPKFFRFPGLCHTPKDVDLVAKEGEVVVDWDVNISDAFAKNPQLVAAALAQQAKPGTIFVFHLNGAPNAPETLAIVKRLLPAVKAKGLEPVTLDQMQG